MAGAYLGRVAWIIDYQHVLARMRALGFRSAYYNSGAFAFASTDAQQTIVGWIGPDDPTIRPDLPATLVRVPAPYEDRLAEKFLTIWPARLDGPAWMVPKSHWSFEMDHGSRTWLPGVIERAGVDPGLLESRTNAAAIEFSPDEAPSLSIVVQSLLSHLESSDFAILFPHHAHLVTVHHHKQLWWQTRDAQFAAYLA